MEMTIRPSAIARIRQFFYRYSDAVENFIFWRIPFGASIIMPWLTTPDPNEAWRPYLESNVGQQNILWGWRINDIGTREGIEIKFLRKKDAMMFALRYGT